MYQVIGTRDFSFGRWSCASPFHGRDDMAGRDGGVRPRPRHVAGCPRAQLREDRSSSSGAGRARAPSHLDRSALEAPHEWNVRPHRRSRTSRTSPADPLHLHVRHAARLPREHPTSPESRLGSALLRQRHARHPRPARRDHPDRARPFAATIAALSGSSDVRVRRSLASSLRVGIAPRTQPLANPARQIRHDDRSSRRRPTTEQFPVIFVDLVNRGRFGWKIECRGEHPSFWNPFGWEWLICSWQPYSMVRSHISPEPDRMETARRISSVIPVWSISCPGACPSRSCRLRFGISAQIR